MSARYSRIGLKFSSQHPYTPVTPVLGAGLSPLLASMGMYMHVWLSTHRYIHVQINWKYKYVSLFKVSHEKKAHGKHILEIDKTQCLILWKRRQKRERLHRRERDIWWPCISHSGSSWPRLADQPEGSGWWLIFCCLSYTDRVAQRENRLLWSCKGLSW